MRKNILRRVVFGVCLVSIICLGASYSQSRSERPRNLNTGSSGVRNTSSDLRRSTAESKQTSAPNAPKLGNKTNTNDNAGYNTATSLQKRNLGGPNAPLNTAPTASAGHRSYSMTRGGAGTVQKDNGSILIDGRDVPSDRENDSASNGSIQYKNGAASKPAGTGPLIVIDNARSINVPAQTPVIVINPVPSQPAR